MCARPRLTDCGREFCAFHARGRSCAAQTFVIGAVDYPMFGFWLAGALSAGAAARFPAHANLVAALGTLGVAGAFDYENYGGAGIAAGDVMQATFIIAG